jgi:hypothetical protein
MRSAEVSKSILRQSRRIACHMSAEALAVRQIGTKNFTHPQSQGTCQSNQRLFDGRQIA